LINPKYEDGLLTNTTLLTSETHICIV